MRTAPKKGFSLVEMLVVTLVTTIVVVSVGSGMVKLLRLQEMNREKARALEELCFRHARTQPLVAVGAAAIPSEDEEGRVDVKYPFMVFGIACETNELTQVTNTVLRVRDDNVLQTIVQSGASVTPYDVTNAMGFVDRLVDLESMRKSTVVGTNDLVSILYSYRIRVKGMESDVYLGVPVRMRNTDYVGHPDDCDD